MARKLLTVRGGTTPARPCVVQEAGAEGGAGVGSDQGGSWDLAFYAAGARGLCPQEWTLICATHNLLKLWRSGRGILPLVVS